MSPAVRCCVKKPQRDANLRRAHPGKFGRRGASKLGWQPRSRSRRRSVTRWATPPANFYWKTFEFFLLIFYTDVFGISPAVAGTMFGVTRVWDAVADPIMGAIADRTRTRWGRFRPYLLWMALPLAAAGVLTFTTPDLDGGGKTVYAYVTFSFLMLAYTAINIPYSALMGVMTSDTRQRTGAVLAALHRRLQRRRRGGGRPRPGWWRRWARATPSAAGS